MTALAVPATLPAAGQRGRTTIADRVVARVAARAVTEVELTGGVARQLMGITIGRQTGEGSARVDARVDGHLAMIEVRLSLAYPAPVTVAARAAGRLPRCPRAGPRGRSGW